MILQENMRLANGGEVFQILRQEAYRTSPFATYAAINENGDPMLLTTLEERMIPQELQKNDALVRRFQREAQFLERFADQTNLMLFEDFFSMTDEAKGTIHVLATEHPYENAEHVPTLDRWLGQRAIGIDDAIRLILPLVSMVAEFHREGVVMRKISPDCLAVTTRSGKKAPFLTVVDIGNAFFQDSPDGVTTERFTVVIGAQKESAKIAWTTPEQIRRPHDTPTPAMDVYLLALLLFRIWTGVNPHERGSMMDNHISITKHLPTPREEILQAIPSFQAQRDLTHLFQKAFQQEPAERQQNAAELRQQLEAIQRLLQTAEANPEPVHDFTPMSTREAEVQSPIVPTEEPTPLAANRVMSPEESLVLHFDEPEQMQQFRQRQPAAALDQATILSFGPVETDYFQSRSQNDPPVEHEEEPIQIRGGSTRATTVIIVAAVLVVALLGFMYLQ